MRRLIVLAAAGLGLAVLGCALWPERFAVNGPIANLLWGGGIAAPPRDDVPGMLRAADGFTVALWADGLPNARVLRVTPPGDVLVSQPREGRVTLLERDADGDGRPDGVRIVASGLDRPHGIDVGDGWLWIAESGAVGRVRFDPGTRETSGPYTRVVTGLPAGGRHWTRTLHLGPDGLVYVSIGSSCNACEEDDPRRAAILRWRPDGSGQETVASGLRNAVGFAWRPDTGELYATDNGRDLLGDDVPPDEVDRIVPGGFYGWPYAFGDRVPDPELGGLRPERVAASIPPAHAFGAHVAPLGIAFLASPAQPASHRGAALVAQHGSWNRTRKVGYQVVSLHFDAAGGITERPFLTGFLRPDESVIGRPVDVAEAPDGAIYVSDDYAGAVYVVRAGAPRAGARPAATAGGEGPAAGPPPGVLPGDALAAIPAAERERLATRGAALFQTQRCPECHVAHDGKPPERPLDNLSRRWTVERLVVYFVAPTPPMPAVDLPEDDRRALAVHVLRAHP